MPKNTSIEQECRNWAKDDPLSIAYHDKRWCVPVHDEQELFAMLCLEGMQAGLSWRTILNKEQDIRRAFAGFDVEKVASFTEGDMQRLMKTPGIIHNKQKIKSVITNARAFQKVQQEFGSFDTYIWRYTGNKTIVHHPKHFSDVPATSDLSVKLSKDLKKRGFSFVGPKVVYSYMQAIGMYDDHLDDCPYKAIHAQR
jgi:DNA-3-methyladenine glycosylase I